MFTLFMSCAPARAFRWHSGANLLCALAVAVILAMPGGTSAHEGHDHGAAPPPLPATVKPRVAIQTESYELVGVAAGPQLAIFLDRYPSNIPVTDARIEILAGTDTVTAAARPDGSYRAEVPGLIAPGRHDLVFNVSHVDGDDLLAGTLDIPAPSAPDTMTAPGTGARTSP